MMFKCCQKSKRQVGGNRGEGGLGKLYASCITLHFLWAMDPVDNSWKGVHHCCLHMWQFDTLNMVYPENGDLQGSRLTGEEWSSSVQTAQMCRTAKQCRIDRTLFYHHQPLCKYLRETLLAVYSMALFSKGLHTKIYGVWVLATLSKKVDNEMRAP